MQLNTLNRVIALFLIGGFVIVMAAVALEAKIRTLLEPYSKMDLGAPAGVFLAVALLSVTALAGTIVDALGNLTVRRVIRKWIAKERARARVFLCAEEFDEQHLWREAFRTALQSDKRYESLAKDDMIKAASAALFFRSAEKEHTEWLVQHHSMYHLSANFVIVVITVAGWLMYERAYLLAGISIVGAYLLTTFALDNYLYTYQLSFRNAYFALKDSAVIPPAPTPKADSEELSAVVTSPESAERHLAPATAPTT